MNLDDIILEIIEQHSVDKQFDIEEYCKKYPEYRNDIINKLNVAVSSPEKNRLVVVTIQIQYVSNHHEKRTS